jgi:hypothetical protein
MAQKYIELPSQEYLKECFNYDEITGSLYWKERPLSHFKTDRMMKIMNARMANTVAGSVSGGRYLSVIINLKSYRNHRIVWKLVTGSDPTDQIDHINGDKLDNRFENLREANNAQNQYNVGLNKNNTSGFKGVSFDKWYGLWNAAIGFNRKQYRIGRFKTKEQAAEAVMLARESFHKEFTNYGTNNV